MEVEEVEPKETASFSDFPPAKKGKAKGALYLLLLVILGLTVWAVWNYVINAQDEETMTHTEISPVTGGEVPAPTESGQDTTPSSTPSASDSLSMRPSASNDSVGFRIIVGTYNTLIAGQNRLNDMKLSGRNVVLLTKDSVSYMVAEPFPNLPLSDSSKIKDSMRGYYGDRNYIIERIKP